MSLKPGQPHLGLGHINRHRSPKKRVLAERTHIAGEGAKILPMNGVNGESKVVTARLPSGAPLRIEISGGGDEGAGDGVASVGQHELDVEAAIDGMASAGRHEVDVEAAVDGVASVGRHELDVEAAVDSVTEVGSILVEKLKAVKPTRATVELHFGFTLEAGKLTALLVSGQAEASLTITLEWFDQSASGG